MHYRSLHGHCMNVICNSMRAMVSCRSLVSNSRKIVIHHSRDFSCEFDKPRQLLSCFDELDVCGLVLEIGKTYCYNYTGLHSVIHLRSRVINIKHVIDACYCLSRITPNQSHYVLIGDTSATSSLTMSD